MQKKINCKLLTYDAKIFDRELDMIILPGSEGELGILPGHVPIMVSLKKGQIKAYENNSITVYDIAEGFAQITDDGCNIVGVLSKIN